MNKKYKYIIKNNNIIMFKKFIIIGLLSFITFGLFVSAFESSNKYEFKLVQKLTTSDNYLFILQNKNLIIKADLEQESYYKNYNINRDKLNINDLDIKSLKYFNLRELPNGEIIEKSLILNENKDIVCLIIMKVNDEKIKCIVPDFVYFCLHDKINL
jgi:hypothetical protein